MTEYNTYFEGTGEIKSEFKAISTMLKKGNKHGLIVEIVHSFAKFIAGGDKIETAASAALYEWDI